MYEHKDISSTHIFLCIQIRYNFNGKHITQNIILSYMFHAHLNQFMPNGVIILTNPFHIKQVSI